MPLIVKVMSRTEYERLVGQAEVLAEDAYGPKVLETRDGNIVKLFRRKRVVSSKLLFPSARSFERNARRLLARGFRTVHVSGVYRVPAVKRDCVIYRRIPGQAVRELSAGQEKDSHTVDHLVGRVGALLADLHRSGFFFRSVHLGNIVRMPDGELALIDVSDLRVWPLGSLPFEWRMRNFGHIWRYPEDRQIIRAWGVKRFVDAYLEHVCLDSRKREALRLRLEQFLGPSC